MFWAVFFLGAVFSRENQLDINRADFAEIRQLPVDSVMAQEIYEYLMRYGRLNSIYDLLKVPGMTLEKLDELKPLIYISPRSWEDRQKENIQRIQRRLASEDGPSKAVVEEWQDLLVDPLNINRAEVDDLLQLENVSLLDAVAVVKYLRGGGKIESRRDLAGRVPGLSPSGYRGIRNYVTFTDHPRQGWGGNYRLKFETRLDREGVVDNNDFAAALMRLDTDTAELRAAGYTTKEVEFFRQRINVEKSYRFQMKNESSLRHRLRWRLGNKVRAAGWVGENFYEPKPIPEMKGYVMFDGLGPMERLMIGDYRLVLGQGLLMDNDFQLLPRVYKRTEGLFGDLNENPGFGLRGAASKVRFGRTRLLTFYSRSNRDAILNPDSSVNWFIVTTPRYPTFKNILLETTTGGKFKFDLSELGPLPVGTGVGASVLSSQTNRTFQPETRFIDRPGDAENLDDPNYLQLDTGKTRLFYAADFRTAIENFSLEGEVSHQHRGGNAWLLKFAMQYDDLNVNALYRRYGVNYVNHYNRGYCEELRFENTLLEKPFRLLDPAFTALQDFPMPKAEEGVMVETRYQISRMITFTRVYLDLWRNLAWGANNCRFQGEVEYRPTNNLRFRFKEKIQLKENSRIALATQSLSLESAIRALLSLSNWDYFTMEVRSGRTVLTPTLKYGDKASLNGDFIAVQWEHNFSSHFSSELGVASWRSAGMSEWLFEDNTIDFVDGQGWKWYLALSDRVSDHLLFYLKFRHKVSEFPHTGLANNPGVHYADGSRVPDFVTQDNQFHLSMQVDFLW